MRISHVIPNLGVGGAEVMLADLIESQIDRGHEPSVVSLWPREDNVVFERLASAGVQVTYLGKARGFDGSVIVRLRRSLRRLMPDLVHTHRNALPYVMLSGVGCMHYAVHTIHNEPHREAGSAAGLTFRKLAFRTRQIMPVALSGDLAEAVVATYRLRACEVVPNGIPIPVVLPEKTGPKNRFVFVGRMHPDKQPMLALESFAKLRIELGSGHLDLFGDGPLLGPVQAMAVDLGLEKHTTFHGVAHDLRERYGAYDLLLSTSSVEGLPISMLEAMASGVPIISSGVGGTASLLARGRGIIVQDCDAGAYAAAGLKLLRDKDLYASMRRQAFDYCRTHHSSAVMAARYDDVYSRLMN